MAVVVIGIALQTGIRRVLSVPQVVRISELFHQEINSLPAVRVRICWM